MSDELMIKLRSATDGLLYPSEHDSPLEPFVWENSDNSEAVIRRLSKQSEKSWCRTVSVEDFFGETVEVEGFPELYRILKGILTELKVYRFGDIEVAVYVVGLTNDGRLAGFKTQSVET